MDKEHKYLHKTTRKSVVTYKEVYMKMNKGRAILDKLQRNFELLEDYQQRLDALAGNMEVVHFKGANLKIQVNVVATQVITAYLEAFPFRNVSRLLYLCLPLRHSS